MLTLREARRPLQVEAPQVIVEARGRPLLPHRFDAADGRLRGVHSGTYHYTAGCGTAAAHQHARHLACEFAKPVPQVAFAGTRGRDSGVVRAPELDTARARFGLAAGAPRPRRRATD